MMPQAIRARALKRTVQLLMVPAILHVASDRVGAQPPAAQQGGGAAPAAQGAQPATSGGGAAAPAGLPPAEIEKLVAPIALYPDVLISQILPAATFPTEIVQAARWCKAHPDLKGLDDQKWDLSVLSVCRYPPVLSKMDEDLDWTNALGAAFLSQSDDVMAAIQTLRRKAEDNGALKTTPQQTVVNEGATIIIAPAEKEVVYVPQYNPQVVYVDDDDDNYAAAAAVAAGAVSFGVGMAMGAWLDNDCDWHGGCVVGCRPGYWHGWGWHGVAHWDNDWAAYRGPRRGAIVGENGGAYVGPRGAAVWGENGHGAAWRRPNTYGGPVYGGRYSGYNNVVGNRNVVSGNTVNVNRNNVNIDRGDRGYYQGGDRTNIGGDRTNIGGGDRTNVGGGDRTNIGGDRTNVGGDRTNVGAGDRTNVGAGDRTKPAGGDRPNAGGGERPGAGSGNRPPGGGQNQSAFGPRPSTGDVNAARDRGQQSLQGSRPGGDKPTQRPAPQPQRPPTPQQRPQAQPQRQPSSFGASQRSGADVQRYSNRGSSSRGGGGGASRGGGGGGRRR